jgi:hypothetical protein
MHDLAVVAVAKELAHRLRRNIELDCSTATVHAHVCFSCHGMATIIRRQFGLIRRQFSFGKI